MQIKIPLSNGNKLIQGLESTRQKLKVFDRYILHY